MSTVVDGLVLAVRALSKTDKANFIGQVMEDADVIEIMVGRIIDRLTEPVGNRKIKYHTRAGNSPETGVTSFERGRRVRESYISGLQQNGIKIDQVDAVWAKTAVGLWVAVPFATERAPNRWFLGLPEKKVRERIRNGGVSIVLLCQPESGSTLDFVLPPSRVQEIVDKSSKSKGDLKFNVRKVGNRYYYLGMTDDVPLDVSEFKGKVSVFQS